MPERRSKARKGPDRRRAVPRRNSRRVIEPLRIPVFWTVNGMRKDGFIFDVGLGGCFLNTSFPAERDDEVVLELPEPPQGVSVVKFRCTVIPQTRHLEGFGLRFRSLNKRQQAAVGYFMAKAPQSPDRR